MMVVIILLLHLIAVVYSNCVSEPYKCSLAGSEVTLYCESSKHGITPYFIDPMGRQITTNRDGDIDIEEFHGETTLTFRNAAFSDSGTYECVSGNCRENITLVIYEDIEFPHRDTESSQLLQSNSQGVISCTVSSVPAANTEWYFNDERIYDNEDRYINGTNLVIKDVTEAHQGNYKCQAVIRKCSLLDKLHISVTVTKGYLQCFKCMNYTKGRPGQYPSDSCSIPSRERFLTTVPCMSNCVTIVAEGREEHDLVSQLIRRDCSDNLYFSTTESNHTLTKVELGELKRKFSLTSITLDYGRIQFCARNHCNKQDADYQNVQSLPHNNKLMPTTESSTNQLTVCKTVYFVITIIGLFCI